MQTYGSAPQRIGTVAPGRGLIGKAMAKPAPKPAQKAQKPRG